MILQKISRWGFTALLPTLFFRMLRMMISKFQIIICFSWIIISATANAANILVVTNKAMNEKVSLDEVKQIFLLNGARTDSGTIFTPVDQKEGSPIRDEFYKKVLGRTKVQMKAYWAQKIFTGKGMPPESVDSVKDLKTAFDRKDQNYISYVYEGESDPEFKVILKVSE